MATMNISLPDIMRTWIQDRIAEGKYASSSDYVRDLIRKDQTRREKTQAMQNAITAGLESGAAKDFDVEKFKKRMMVNHANERV